MNDEQDILADALGQLKGQKIPEAPPPEVVEQTLRQLAEVQPEGTGAANSGPTAFVKLASRLAAAAAVLVLGGYAIGKLSAPDVEQLRAALEPSLAASLEPALRERLTREMKQSYQLALANTYVQVKEELTQQYRQDLNRFAVQTLAASNATTNQLLVQLLDAIKAKQDEDLRRIASALEQAERQRLADREALATHLVALARQTEDELERTRDDFVQLLVDKYSPGRPNDRTRNVTDPNERS